MNGALMVCGTSSDVGKSHVVAGLCRVLARRGVRVAPFKGQNMSLNSAVTAAGHEIGRAQWMQARAAGVDAEVAMNPILLKPTGERASQVVVMGRPVGTLEAAAYQTHKQELRATVLGALDDLRRRFDVVICEGAGSPAEINLMDGDLVNLGLAHRAGVPAVVVGDIERGGVMAALYGTAALLPDELRRIVRGFVVNKFRGDPALLGDAFTDLERRCGVPTLGVLPFLHGVSIDAEDSLALAGGPISTPEDAGALDDLAVTLDVAVLRLPRLSNFTDLDALGVEPAVSVRYVDRPSAFGDPDVVVIPGTKSTVADLEWARRRGLVDALARLRRSPRPPTVLGICGGYQMMGACIEDPDGIEARPGAYPGLGLFDAVTRFGTNKRTVCRAGSEAGSGLPVAGYEIHHGTTSRGSSSQGWFDLAGAASSAGGSNVGGSNVGGSEVGGSEVEGCRDDRAGLYGTALHGVLDSDALRSNLLLRAAARRDKAWVPSGVSFAAAREMQLDRLADACEAHLDLNALVAIISEADGG
jgi:adenosylcobyric acid synthase